MNDEFSKAISDGYGFSDPSIVLGSPIIDGKVAAPAHVRVPALVAIGRGVEDGQPHHRHPLDRIASFR